MENISVFIYLTKLISLNNFYSNGYLLKIFRGVKTLY